MKTQSLVIPLVLGAMIFLAGCASSVSAAPGLKPTPSVAQSLPPTNEAIGVVKAYMDTANTGDFAKTLAFYADDAVVFNPLGVFVGKDEISQWLADDVKTTRAKAVDFQVQGSMVVDGHGIPGSLPEGGHWRRCLSG